MENWLNKRVMIVDDSEMVRKVLRTLFESVGLVVVAEAENGEHALELLRQEVTPDLISLDLIMPVMGGIDCYTQIKEMRIDAEFLVVSCIGALDSDAHARMATLTGVEFVSKLPSKSGLEKALFNIFSSGTDYAPINHIGTYEAS
jgi:CheY-like chemotaxis protein